MFIYLLESGLDPHHRLTTAGYREYCKKIVKVSSLDTLGLKLVNSSWWPWVILSA